MIIFLQKNIKAEDNNNIFHLIMARQKTQAGDYYNNFVIKFLRNQMNKISISYCKKNKKVFLSSFKRFS